MEKIKYLLYDIKDCLVDIFDSITRVLRWMPIIWKDWDSSNLHIYKILNFKLNNMYKFFKEDTWSSKEENEERCKGIGKAIKLTQRLVDNKYENLDKLFTKWGKPEIADNGILFPGIKSDEDIKVYEKDYIKLQKEAERARAADIKALSRLLIKEAPKWEL